MANCRFLLNDGSYVLLNVSDSFLLMNDDSCVAADHVTADPISTRTYAQKRNSPRRVHSYYGQSPMMRSRGR
jgi:hypothetical protein